MRNKTLISSKLDRIESELTRLRYTLGAMDRDESYVYLGKVKDLLEQIATLINTETQE